MNEFEYRLLQSKLNAKLKHCNGNTGKRREGYEEAILNVKSMLHELYKEENKMDEEVE